MGDGSQGSPPPQGCLPRGLASLTPPLRTSSELGTLPLFPEGLETDKREMCFLLSRHRILTLN